MKKKVLSGFVAGSLLVVFGALSSYGAPEVTEVELDTAVNAGYYVVVFDKACNGNGVFIDQGQTSGNSTTNPTGAASNPALGPCVAAPAEMFGVSTGYGHLLLSLMDSGLDPTVTGAELTAIRDGLPTNANPEIFGAAAGPVNKVNIELDRAIPVGTEVTFTVDMNDEVPHLVAVMGGTAPTVTYDSSGTGTLTVKTTTFDSTTNAGDIFNSMIGFMIFTDTTLGTTPLRIITQTNHWVGDIFPLLPGFDSDAAVEDAGGTQGTITAKCGTTIYGPTGGERNINVFFPDSSIEAIFGSGITNTSLAAFANSTQESNATIDREVTNFGLPGTLAQFTYTFASGKDTAMGAVLPCTSALAEINPTTVTTNVQDQAFSYYIEPTIGTGDSGVNKIEITVPSTYSDVTITGVFAGDSSTSYTDNTSGNTISVTLDTTITTSGTDLQVNFTADTPTEEDSGVNFTSTLDDTSYPSAVNCTSGDGDGGGTVTTDTWTVTASVDTTPPSEPSSPTVDSGSTTSSQIKLTWTDSSDSDLAGLLIVRNTEDSFTAPTDGTTYSNSSSSVVLQHLSGAASSGPGDLWCVNVDKGVETYTNTGLSASTTYYYKIYGYDEAKNYSLSPSTISGTTSVSGGGSGGPCFIATAAYGTPMAKEVKTLSRFRDKYLLTNKMGKEFVSFYCCHSPAWARYIENKESIKVLVRAVLKPIVRLTELITDGQ